MSDNPVIIVYREYDIGKKFVKMKYVAEVTHKFLNEYKEFTSSDKDILNNKVNVYVKKLNEKWKRYKKLETINKSKLASKKEAEKRTKAAIKDLKEIDNILLATLKIDDTVNWDELKDISQFSVPHPTNTLETFRPIKSLPIPYDPKPELAQFIPNKNILDFIFKNRFEKKIEKANLQFDLAVQNWSESCRNIDKQNIDIVNDYTIKLEEFNTRVAMEVSRWEEEESNFNKNQKVINDKVDKLKADYLLQNESAVVEYCELVLNNSKYPENFPKTFDLDYTNSNKILIVEYTLPSIENFPSLNEVKFVKDELKEYFISETQLQKLFDSTMYNITLRTLHELFEADKANAIESISFNGWINSINRSTGKMENNCILSVQAKKTEFENIELAQVDPKACFKNLKGVGSSKLSGLTPIQPILQINKSDKRFINHYEVANTLDSATNLASMDWEDFEHLIREVFANEFSTNGGEVKVTQASRDGGVDAIAFDPDPIRGGKIVIQAKRYSNTVGVSAVRDLYGTVLNEGATKGILVTTADYGSDAYEFVRGKPLTLMNGANLLYLLEKHGHKAKIDLKEARRNK